MLNCHQFDWMTREICSKRMTRRVSTLTAIIASLAGTPAGWAQDAGLNEMVQEMFDEFAGVPDQGVDDEGDVSADIEQAGSQQADDEPVDLSYLEDKVHVNEYDLVDLHVNNEDLGNVLQLLSLQSQRNIVASNNVTATVTADLYNVTFQEALDAILHVNGFGYVDKGNFIYVYTAEELAEIEKSSRVLVSRTISLNFLNAADASTFVQPLLSGEGKITATNQAAPYSIGSGTPVGGEDYASSAMLVIFDYEENIDQIASLLQQLDTRPVQVLVEATILQTSLNEANAFGVDFSILNNMDFVDFVGSGPLGVVNDLISGVGATMSGGSTTATTVPIRGNGAAVNTSVGKVSDAAGIKAGIINEDVAVFLRLLDEVTDVTVVSNPKLLTLNRQPARVLVGTKVGYLQTTSTQTSSTQSVEFLDTGTQLNVRPFVSSDGAIRLELMPQVSSFRLREVTDANNATVTIPDEDTSELVTNVMVRDGQTVVLGGLFTETTTASRRQVPGLGDIPIIGGAFRGHDDTTRRSEIIFMITPTIVNDAMLTEAGERGNAYMDYTRAGARKGLLPWSRERRVSRLLQEAEDAVRDGNRELALSKIRWALQLHPQNPSARRLLDQLGEFETGESSSMLNDVLQHELDLPEPSASATTHAEFLRPQVMSIDMGDSETGSISTDWLLSEGDAVPQAWADSSSTDPEPGDWGEVSGSFEQASTEPVPATVGEDGFYQLTEEELTLRQSAPVVFGPENTWLPDQAQWAPQPGDFIAREDGTLEQVDSSDTAATDETMASSTIPSEDPAFTETQPEFTEQAAADQDFSKDWGQDEFTAAFGEDAEQQPWFFPIHGGLVWIPIPRGFIPADQAESLFGQTEEQISTVPTEDGGIDD